MRLWVLSKRPWRKISDSLVRILRLKALHDQTQSLSLTPTTWTFTVKEWRPLHQSDTALASIRDLEIARRGSTMPFKSMRCPTSPLCNSKCICIWSHDLWFVLVSIKQMPWLQSPQLQLFCALKCSWHFTWLCSAWWCKVCTASGPTFGPGCYVTWKLHKMFLMFRLWL